MRARGNRSRGQAGGRLAIEGLERRAVMAVDLPVAPAVVPSFLVDPAAELAPLTTPASPALAAAMPVSIVRSADPLFGYQFAAATPERAYGYAFVQGGRSSRTEIPVSLVDLPLGSTLELEVLTGLSSWNGTGQPAFKPVARGLEINLNVAGRDLRIGANTDQPLGPRAGSIRRSIDVAVSDGLPFTRRIEATIGTGGTRSSFEKPGAAAGIYAFTGLWSVRNATGIRDSAPVTFVFTVGEVSPASRDRALAFFSAAATRPVAIVAVAAEAVTPVGPGQTFLRVNVQYSDPVTSAGRTPQLPVLFDSTLRLADLERSTPRSNTTTLSFVLVPTARDREAAFVRLGESLRLPSGGTLRSAGGAPAVLSLPPSSTPLSVNLGRAVSVVSTDIDRNTTFRAGTTYVVDGEVRVRAGVTLTIEDGVTVLIRNGRRMNRTLTANALIFDSGSRLRARTVYFKAADAGDRIASVADNGGVFFLGSSRDALKDGVSVDTRRGVGPSSFQADLIVTSFLGRTDPLFGDGDAAERDDIDGISLLGLGRTEWRVKGVRSENSGDDGFDVTNSSIAMDSLVVVNPLEDGLNISSSFVEIRRELTVVMSRSRAADRELFDLEVDDGPSRVLMQRQAAVDLRGYWGSVYDEVSLNSLDMPPPPRRGFESRWYEFTGILQKGPAIVYSLHAD